MPSAIRTAAAHRPPKSIQDPIGWLSDLGSLFLVRHPYHEDPKRRPNSENYPFSNREAVTLAGEPRLEDHGWTTLRSRHAAWLSVPSFMSPWFAVAALEGTPLLAKRGQGIEVAMATVAAPELVLTLR